MPYSQILSVHNFPPKSSDPSTLASDELQSMIHQLVVQYRRGEQSAMTTLHDRLTPGLARFFGRKLGELIHTPLSDGQSERVDELVQNTWIEFCRALQFNKYDPTRGRYTTFLYAVASNIWLRWLRERGRRREAPLPDGDEWLPASSHADSAHAAELARALELVERVISGLDASAPFTDHDRAILRSIAEDRTERDLAHELGVSASTAHERRRSLLTRFANFLHGRGIDFSQNVRATAQPESEERVRAQRAAHEIRKPL